MLPGCNYPGSVASGTVDSKGSLPITTSSNFGNETGSGGSVSGNSGCGVALPQLSLMDCKLKSSSGQGVSTYSDQIDAGVEQSKCGDHTDATPTNPPQQFSGSNELNSYKINVYKCDSTKEARMPVSRNSEEYNMSHRRRGLAVIFNNEEFGHEKRREGSNHDVTALHTMYQLLGFEVEVHNNLDIDKLRATITNLTQQDYSDCDCLSITVLTHGLESNYLHARDYLYRVEQLWQPFTADLCPTLAGKPKLFFIQACRGHNCDKGVRLMSRTQSDSVGGDSYKIPKMADFLIFFSTVEGFYSWRNPEQGSWFIQSLCRVLTERYDTADLLKMMTVVCRSVAIDYESNDPKNIKMHQQKEVPSLYSTLIRDVHFRPKPKEIL